MARGQFDSIWVVAYETRETSEDDLNEAIEQLAMRQ
jgi:hypothetical protein